MQQVTTVVLHMSMYAVTVSPLELSAFPRYMVTSYNTAIAHAF